MKNAAKSSPLIYLITPAFSNIVERDNKSDRANNYGCGANADADRQDCPLLQPNNTPLRRRVSVESDLFCCPMPVNCSREKPLRGLSVSVPAQHKVNRVSLLINSSIKILPSAANAGICFIRSPRTTGRASEAAPSLFEPRDVALHPS
jgi:hypothetical protein